MPRVKARPERSRRIRRKWTIKPLQKPHSTKKGKKGYSRKVEKKKIKKVIKEIYAK